ncbi:MAG: hypothetical protein Q7R92_04300 [bacterium]|nr:hypothetical protein [bacterium]
MKRGILVVLAGLFFMAAGIGIGISIMRPDGPSGDQRQSVAATDDRVVSDQAKPAVDEGKSPAEYVGTAKTTDKKTGQVTIDVSGIFGKN